MSVDALHDHLAALQETARQLNHLIERLANLFDGFSPETQDGISSAELATDIGHMIREEEDELELLVEEIKDIRHGRPGSQTETERLHLKESVARLEQDLQSHRMSFRKAQTAARQRLQQSQRLARESLLLQLWNDAGVTAEPDNDEKTDAVVAQQQNQQPTSPRYHRPMAETSLLSAEEQRMVSTGSSVTQALREMHEMMTTELAKSDFARETLDESTRMMKNLGESYDSLDTMVASSVSLVGTLMRSQKSDTWYLKTSFYMLLAVLAWLVFRRWLYGPLWWLVWLPLRLLVGASWKTGTVIVSSSSSSSSSSLLSGRGAVDGTASLGSMGSGVTDGRIRVDGLPDEGMPILKVAPMPDGAENGDKTLSDLVDDKGAREKDEL